VGFGSILTYFGVFLRNFEVFGVGIIRVLLCFGCFVDCNMWVVGFWGFRGFCVILG